MKMVQINMASLFFPVVLLDLAMEKREIGF